LISLCTTKLFFSPPASPAGRLDYCRPISSTVHSERTHFFFFAFLFRVRIHDHLFCPCFPILGSFLMFSFCLSTSCSVFFEPHHEGILHDLKPGPTTFFLSLSLQPHWFSQTFPMIRDRLLRPLPFFVSPHSTPLPLSL